MYCEYDKLLSDGGLFMVVVSIVTSWSYFKL